MRIRTAVVALLAVLAAAGCGRIGGEPFQPTLNTAVTLEPGEVVAQTVNPAGEEISAVAVEVATFDAAPDPGGVLTVTLVDPTAGDVLAAEEVSGDALADGAWAEAAFDPPAPVGDVVLVEVTWDGTSPVALWANRPLDDTEGIINDPYAAGELVLAGRPVAGDLAFRVTSPTGPDELVDHVTEVLRSAGARLADAPVFAVMWLLALAGAVALAGWGLRRGRPAPADDV